MNDHHIDMDTDEITGLIYDYTSGYPFLVSRLCKLIDEKVEGTGRFPDKEAAWTKDSILEIVKLLLSEKNTLFESLMEKLMDHPELKQGIYSMLFCRERIVFGPFEFSMAMVLMFKVAAQNTLQFIRNGRLDMELVLKKFVEHFDSIYGDSQEELNEEEGHR